MNGGRRHGRRGRRKKGRREGREEGRKKPFQTLSNFQLTWLEPGLYSFKEVSSGWCAPIQFLLLMKPECAAGETEVGSTPAVWGFQGITDTPCVKLLTNQPGSPVSTSQMGLLAGFMAEKSPELGCSMNVRAHQADGRRLQSVQTQKPREPDFSGDLPGRHILVGGRKSNLKAYFAT